MSVRKKSSRHRKDSSGSGSSSSDSGESVERPEDLLKELKKAIQGGERFNLVYDLLYRIEKKFPKESMGILRVSIPGNFSFNQSDMEEFFRKYGKI